MRLQEIVKVSGEYHLATTSDWEALGATMGIAIPLEVASPLSVIAGLRLGEFFTFCRPVSRNTNVSAYVHTRAVQYSMTHSPLGGVPPITPTQAEGLFVFAISDNGDYIALDCPDRVAANSISVVIPREGRVESHVMCIDELIRALVDNEFDSDVVPADWHQCSRTFTSASA